MKSAALPLLLCSILLTACHLASNKGVRISGSIKHAAQEYINLTHVSRLRGNLNFDGFRSIGTVIDANGNFRLHSERITDGANYLLAFQDKGISLFLFEGDNIHLDFDMDDPDTSLFATGKGAGKVNVLYLEQLGFENFDLDREGSLDEFAAHVDSVISEQVSLLDAIYYKAQNDSRIVAAGNKAAIQKIITHSPLTQHEYEFLVNRITSRRYDLQTYRLARMSDMEDLDSVEIDLESLAFSHFNSQEYRKINNISDWQLANSLESILQIEFLKAQTLEKDLKVTYGNWSSFFNSEDYRNWVAAYLKSNFSPDVYNNYYADLAGIAMTLGWDHKEYLEHLNADENNNKYLERLRAYEDLLNVDLNDKEYGLYEDARTLDHSKFASLLERYKGEPLYIVFWSAQFAGASIINQLPSIKDFERANQDKINVVHISIDKEENKKLWAARIIDNSWKSQHYFLPMEGNDSLLNKFSDKKISAFCDGGATYAFIDKGGIIKTGIESPFRLSKSEIEEMYK